MARVLTTFVTPSNAVVDSPFRSVTPKRAILKRHVNDTSDLSEFDSTIADFIEFPFGPKDLKYDGMAAKLVEVARPGKRPLLEKENNGLRAVVFNAVIADKTTGGKISVIPMLQTLEMLAGSGATCTFTYGTTKLGFNVCLSNFNYTVKYRNSEGEPVRVDASVTLKEKPVFTQELVQLDVIPFTPPPTKPSAPAEDPPDLPPWLQVGTNLNSAITAEQLDRLKVLYQKYLEDPQTYGQQYEDSLLNLVGYITPNIPFSSST
tara:strand:- start:1288 stop:2073 length:786 start_codon:yes stop_codon:yes gene_type:complete